MAPLASDEAAAATCHLRDLALLLLPLGARRCRNAGHLLQDCRRPHRFQKRAGLARGLDRHFVQIRFRQLRANSAPRTTRGLAKARSR